MRRRDEWPAGSVGVRAVDLASGDLSWETPLATGLGSPDGTDVAFSGSELLLAHRNASAGFDLARLDAATGDVVASEPMGSTWWPFVTAEGRVGHVYADDSQDDTLTLVVRDHVLGTLWTYDFPPPSAPPPGGEAAYSTPTPTMADGKVYIAVGAALQAFDAAGCGASQCAPLWTSRLLGSNQPPIAGADGRVFIVSARSYEYRGGRYHTANLDVLDGTSGSPLWSATYRGGNVISNGGISDVAVAGDTVYVSGYRDLPPDGREHTLTAYAAAGCEGDPCALWTAQAPEGVLAVAGGVVYLGDREFEAGDVRAFAAEGCGATTCVPLTSVAVPGSRADDVRGTRQPRRQLERLPRGRVGTDCVHRPLNPAWP
jgi:outer membrane protein assembly factor BamB